MIHTSSFKKATLAIGISVAFAAMPLSSAWAQYTGPNSTAPLTTVKQLLASGKDDQQVTLRGFIVSHETGDHYIFSDDTGRLKVEIDSKYFPAGKKVDEKVKVELSGEFDKDLVGKKAELDVTNLRIVTEK